MSRNRTALLLVTSILTIFSLSSTAQELMVEFRVYVSYGSRVGPSDANGQAGVAATGRSAGIGEHPTDLASTMQIRVQVIGDSGSTTGEKSPNSEGYASFNVVGEIRQGQNRFFPGYRVRVFGPDIEETWAENVQPGIGDRFLNITIRRKGEKAEKQPKDSKSTVSASALAIPGKAQKEFDKGNEALSDDKLDKAKEHFQKAAELYPNFDLAYNNLGVVLMKMGDKAGGKQAFEKALAINEKSARAYVNLAKIDVQEQKYEDAIALFNRSLSIEPLNTEALNGVCQSGVLVKKFDQVVGAAKKIHSLPHDNLPMCHFAAGLAYQNLNKPADALAEYNLYLKEASMTDALVAKAREAIEEINKSAVQQ